MSACVSRPRLNQFWAIAPDLRLSRRSNCPDNDPTPITDGPTADGPTTMVQPLMLPMDLDAAKDTLKSLVEGVDPVTGYPIPKSMVLHHAIVIRALVCALAVLEADAV